MNNLFIKIEDEVLSNEELMFDEHKINEFISSQIIKTLSETPNNVNFLFEDIIYQFFEYINIPIIKTKKTRDFGIDGIITVNLELLGDIDLGLQIKNTKIDSKDIDVFLTSLKNAELHLGVIVCKDSTSLQKYELNSRIRTILLAKGIKMKENIIKESINLNPVFILKIEDVIDILASRIRELVLSIYKK